MSKASAVRRWIVILAIGGLVCAVALPNFLRARERSRATTILNDARMLDVAIDQWAMDHQAKAGDTVTWEDVAHYLKPGTRLRENGGKDLWGNSFIIGPTREDG